MRISYNWLRELLPELTASPQEIAAALTKHAFEVEVRHEQVIDPHIIVAEITALEPHPNADRLRLATITTGKETLTVVCGAPNIGVGQRVPFSPSGTILQDEHGHPFTLKPAKIRGVISPGMLNSPRELGFGDWHGGIYVLPQDVPVGSLLAEHMPPDTILEADITPNRAHDAASHQGVARELRAIFGLPHQTETSQSQAVPQLKQLVLNIDEPNRVLRYQAIQFDHVQVKPSPLWLQARLWAVGQRPINNIVDVTNYVMFEYGNPSHAFDTDLLLANDLGVRLATSGETMQALDGNKYDLNEKNLIITSGNQPIALAGLIGGESTAVTDETKALTLEVASFAAYTIHTSANSLGLRTESSARFAKGLSPQLVTTATTRLIELLQETADARVLGQQEYYPRPAVETTITVAPARVTQIAGMDIAPERIKETLERLDCQIDTTNHEAWQVTPPLDRLDLTAEHDIVEEVVRLIGLDKIPAIPPVSKTALALPSPIQWREAIRDLLVAAGMTETYNYSFDHESYRDLLQQQTPKPDIEVINPPSPEQRHLRASLIPRLLEQVMVNKGEFRRKAVAGERALFEIGTVFTAGEGGKVNGILERDMVAGVWIGQGDIDARIRGIVSDVLALLNIPDRHDLVQIMTASQHSAFAKKLGVPIASFELDLTAAINGTEVTPTYHATLDQSATQYAEINRYPATYRDISLLIDPSISTDQVEEIIHRVGGQLVVDVDLFDEYQPADQPQRGVAFHIAYQATDRTLTNDEVQALHNQIVSTLQQEIGATERA